MKTTTNIFSKLSAKQIKTFAALIIMSTLSFQALASISDEEINSDLAMLTTSEEELVIEDWMTTPFELRIGEEFAFDNFKAMTVETIVEEELAIEDWMTTPFELRIGEEFSFDNFKAMTVETIVEEELAIEDWMTTPF